MDRSVQRLGLWVGLEFYVVLRSRPDRIGFYFEEEVGS
jgi:hypothetical protein